MKIAVRLLSLLLLPFLALRAAPAPAVHDVRDYGAIGDGQTVNTVALQKAIDAANGAGGGTVLFTGGRYVTGTLYLKSHVTLRIETGAELAGSPVIDDYAADTFHTMIKNEVHMDRCLLFARDATNITLEGRGTIDGQGKLFPNAGDPVKNRPMLIRFLNCTNLRVRDLTLFAPASWTSSWLYCSDIAIDGITIHSRANINGDGLDFDGCDAVHVSNSTFDNSDDCICLQTSRADRPCRDVTVTNCRLTSRWSGMRIGLLSRGDIENVTVTNCTFRDIRDSGLKLQMGEGAALRNMTFSNLTMVNVLKPVFMTLSQHRAAVDAPEEFAPTGTMRGFLFSNISVETATGGPDAAFILTGLPGHALEDITFSDIRATFAGGGTAAHAQHIPAELVPENLKGRWPEYSRFGRHDPLRAVSTPAMSPGLALRNLAFRTTAPDARPPVIFGGCERRPEQRHSRRRCAIAFTLPTRQALRLCPDPLLPAVAFWPSSVVAPRFSALRSPVAPLPTAASLGAAVPATLPELAPRACSSITMAMASPPAPPTVRASRLPRRGSDHRRTRRESLVPESAARAHRTALGNDLPDRRPLPRRPLGTRLWRPAVAFPPTGTRPAVVFRGAPPGRRPAPFVGVKTQPSSMCFWTVDAAGISLWLDFRNGGSPSLPGDREIPAVTLVSLASELGESPFATITRFCRALLSRRPRLAPAPICGNNNWYYAYGHNFDADAMRRDAAFLAEISAGHHNRPFCA